MPKKIENVRELLLKEGVRLLEEEGYSKFTVRSVAKACGLGLGTVYNYFPSKDALIATHLLEDWRTHLAVMQTCALEGVERLECVYSHLEAFMERHQSLFSDPKAKVSYANASSTWHKQLLSQLVEIVLPVCEGENRQFLAEFIVEALLVHSARGADFSLLIPIFEKLLK
ncbi:MAG: TetR/AcrR family transcriptional regulator [Clostridia bacterium]|nr:TetR/AcrR family transcriptional regulator [Clostridia bacterium]